MTLRSSALVTQTALPSTATAVGVTPTGIAWTTRFVCGSIRDTVPSNEFATQTAPAPTAIPLGIAADVDPLDDDARPGSMRDTVPSRAFVTHTDPSPTATLVGPLPTGTSATSRFDPASIAATEFADAELEPRAVSAGELDDRRRHSPPTGGDGADRDQDAAPAATVGRRGRGSAGWIELRVLS